MEKIFSPKSQSKIKKQIAFKFRYLLYKIEKIFRGF